MANKSLQGKVIAVTGAASGIGHATSVILWERGATLALSDLNTKALESAATTITSTTPPCRDQILTTDTVDVSKPTSVETWIAQVAKTHGRLDGAANVAGVMHDVKPFAALTDEDWNVVLGVNGTGVFNCMRAQLRVMQPARYGSIVNVTSVLGSCGLANSAAYVASKHMVVGLTRAAAVEAGTDGVRVNAVAPGTIATAMTEELVRSPQVLGGLMAKTPMGRVASPREVGNVIAHLLSEDASYQTGAIVAVDGGWTAA